MTKIITNLLFWTVLISSLNLTFTSEMRRFEIEAPHKQFLRRGLLKSLAETLQDKPHLDISQCTKDVLKWALSLAKEDESWGWSMLDAAAKVPSGLLKLNMVSLGQYDQCIAARNNATKDARLIKGKYCLANVRLLSITTDIVGLALPILVNLTQDLSPIIDGYTLTMGTCIPHTCTANDLNLVMNQISLLWNRTDPWVVFNDVTCSTDDDETELNAGSIVAIVIFSIFGILLVASTLYDVIPKDEDKINTRLNLAMKSFSVYSNLENVMKVRKSPSSIQCLNGIRAISILWVIFGHRYLTTTIYPIQNTLDGVKYLKNYMSTFVTGAPIGVDTFFFMSGFLLSYICLKKYSNNRAPFNIGLFYLHRFLRLWPSMAAAILLAATLFPYLGSGPVWTYAKSIMCTKCESNWWVSLLYVANYVRVFEQCFGVLWYLCVDTQLYVLSPILLYPLFKYKRIGLGNLIFWIIVQQICLITIVFLHNWPASIGDQEYTKKYYQPTHMRATPWLLGFLGGYCMYSMRNKKLKINKFVALALWLASLAIMLSVVLGVQSFWKDFLFPNPTKSADGMYNAFARTGWSIALFWVIYACTNGYGGPINWFLGLSYWELISRISYSMYITHTLLQHWYSGSTRDTVDFNQFTLVKLFFADVTITILVSFFWTLTFEMPFITLEKVLLYKEPKTELKKDIASPTDDINESPAEIISGEKS